MITVRNAVSDQMRNSMSQMPSISTVSSSCAGGRRTRLVLAKVLAACLLIGAIPGYGQTESPAKAQGQDLQKQIDELRAVVLRLEQKIDQLQGQQTAAEAVSVESAKKLDQAVKQLAPPPSEAKATAQLQPEDRAVLDFFQSTTIGIGVDGYYQYNFNQPIGRVNLLRAYDVTSNSFSLSQINLIFDHAPNIKTGSRIGGRVDFQYGAATETVQGGAQNELRPQVYRNLWQAYGTYVAPVGSGLTVDFGKWAGSLGVEGNYNKDQINYTRGYFFNYLPFYHMGFRVSYPVSDKFSVTGWLVNGAQQVEDFNGFKSTALLLAYKPAKSVVWNFNYYTGQEQRDVVANYNPDVPVSPTQPGLPSANLNPAPNGREHILDTYLTWNPTGKLTLIGEADYVVNRVYDYSSPDHVTGGAAYARYQLNPKWAFSARTEYLSDRGGLFSGKTQALKEVTTTAEYKVAEGLLLRGEWRRDFSNQRFFLTDKNGVLKKDQNTSTLGMIWWFGSKQGSW